MAELSIRHNEYVALVGPNGAGKSLLLQVMARLRPPTSGDIVFDEANSSALPAGIVFQSPDDQIVGSTVERDVAFGLESLALPSPEIRRRVDAALAAADLRRLTGRPPHLLSDGEKQRVSLASVLVLEPSLLLLDEPTSCLDPDGRRAFLERIRQVRDRRDTTLVHVTHRLDEIQGADRVVGLREGRVVFDGSPAELLAAGSVEALGILAPGVDRPRGPTRDRGGDEADGDARPLVDVRGVRWTVDDGTGKPREVLRGVDLTIHSGERMGLVGPSGAGKTTLAAIVGGLFEPTGGEVRWADAAPPTHASLPGSPAAPRRAPVALVFQDPERGFFEESVLADVAFGPRSFGLAETAAVERARTALRKVGLDPDVFGDRPPETLSGGEARRAAIAGILSLEARLLVLDEPSSGLDADGRARLHDVLEELGREGVAMLVISHDVPFLLAACDRLAVLEEGRIVWDGPTSRAEAELPAPWRAADAIPLGRGASS
ncbi:MAG: energy-coupling factor transporter ATPase [bacterium]